MSCILRASPRPRSGRFAAGARTSPGPGHTPAAAPPPLRPQQLLSLLFSSSRGAGSRHRSRGAGRGAFTRGGAAPSRAGLCRPHPRQPRAGGAPGTMSTGMRYKSKLLNPGEALGRRGGTRSHPSPHGPFSLLFSPRCRASRPRLPRSHRCAPQRRSR